MPSANEVLPTAVLPIRLTLLLLPLALLTRRRWPLLLAVALLDAASTPLVGRALMRAVVGDQVHGSLRRAPPTRTSRPSRDRNTSTAVTSCLTTTARAADALDALQRGAADARALGDDHMWRDAWAFKDHGKSFEAIYERDHPPGFRYVYESFGTNWRMLEVQAAIGRIQLRKLPAWHARRHAIGSRIDAALPELLALRVPIVPERLRHAYDRTYAYLRLEALRGDWDRQRIADEVSARRPLLRRQRRRDLPREGLPRRWARAGRATARGARAGRDVAVPPVPPDAHG